MKYALLFCLLNLSVGRGNEALPVSIDYDGGARPTMSALSCNWQRNTSWAPDGKPVDGNAVAFVAAPQSYIQSGAVSLGDWAKITNPLTGQFAWARVADIRPDSAAVHEISPAAARAVGVGDDATCAETNVIVTFYKSPGKNS